MISRCFSEMCHYSSYSSVVMNAYNQSINPVVKVRQYGELERGSSPKA
jgi:hypothetical protein